LLVLAGLLAPAAARANGAFPDGQTILAPRGLAGEILLATNFGVVETTDGGQSWLWSCEQPVNNYGRLYQMGPAPGYRLFAIANSKLIFSDDRVCGWQVAGGTLAGSSVQDAFADPNDAGHVLAVALTFAGGGHAYTVVESRDGGASFGAPIFTADPGDLITGVEIAAGDASSVHLALSHGSLLSPALARSDDGGATWALADLSAALGFDQVRILAVDREDPDRVFLRGLGPTGDVLAISDAAEPDVPIPLTFSNGQMTAFVQTAAGTLFAAGTSAGVPVLFRSDDGGASFAPVPGAPPILSLAERDGILYAATDTTGVPYAEATSEDGGMTWVPALRFADIDAIAGCVAAACQTECQARADQGQWPAAMCAAAPPSNPIVVDPVDAGPPVDPVDASLPPPPLVDAAARRDATTVPAPTDAAPIAVDAGDVARPRTPAGCSCDVTPYGGGGVLMLLWVLPALLRLPRRRP
jgi:hypothetical protein